MSQCSDAELLLLLQHMPQVPGQPSTSCRHVLRCLQREPPRQAPKQVGESSSSAVGGCSEQERQPTFSRGVMDTAACLPDRSRAPRMTLISSVLRYPPSPSVLLCRSTRAFSWPRRNRACRIKGEQLRPLVYVPAQ